VTRHGGLVIAWYASVVATNLAEGDKLTIAPPSRIRARAVGWDECRLDVDGEDAPEIIGVHLMMGAGR
jgi:hypothetical protein